MRTDIIKESTSIKLEWDRERNFMLQQNELLISFSFHQTTCSVSSEQLEWEQWMFPTYAPFNFCNLTRSNSKKERIPLSLRSLYCGKARRLRNYLKDTFNFSKETSFSNQIFFFNQSFYCKDLGAIFFLFQLWNSQDLYMVRCY